MKVYFYSGETASFLFRKLDLTFTMILFKNFRLFWDFHKKKLKIHEHVD